MTESDTDFFFGRGRETAAVIGALAATPDKLPVLLGNSGVGNEFDVIMPVAAAQRAADHKHYIGVAVVSAASTVLAGGAAEL